MGQKVLGGIGKTSPEIIFSSLEVITLLNSGKLNLKYLLGDE